MPTQDVQSPDIAFPVLEDRAYLCVRAVIQWLQAIFQTRPVGTFRWRPLADDTEIVITGEEPSGSERTNKRPHIAVLRTPVNYVNSSLGQVQTPAFNNDDATFTDLVQGAFVITVIAREGIEAQSLAYQLFRLIPMFRGTLNRLGQMQVYPGRMTLSGETPYRAIQQGSSVPEWKSVTLMLPFTVQDTFSIDSGRYNAYVRKIEQTIIDMDLNSP